MNREGLTRLLILVAGSRCRVSHRVTFALNGRPVLSQTFDQAETLVRLPIPGSGSFWLTITVEAPTSPAALGNSTDARTLGFWLSRLRIVENDREDGACAGPEPG